MTLCDLKHHMYANNNIFYWLSHQKDTQELVFWESGGFTGEVMIRGGFVLISACRSWFSRVRFHGFLKFTKVYGYKNLFQESLSDPRLVIVVRPTSWLAFKTSSRPETYKIPCTPWQRQSQSHMKGAKICNTRPLLRLIRFLSNFSTRLCFGLWPVTIIDWFANH